MFYLLHAPLDRLIPGLGALDKLSHFTLFKWLSLVYSNESATLVRAIASDQLEVFFLGWCFANKIKVTSERPHWLDDYERYIGKPIGKIPPYVLKQFVEWHGEGDMSSLGHYIQLTSDNPRVDEFIDNQVPFYLDVHDDGKLWLHEEGSGPVPSDPQVVEVLSMSGSGQWQVPDTCKFVPVHDARPEPLPGVEWMSKSQDAYLSSFQALLGNESSSDLDEARFHNLLYWSEAKGPERAYALNTEWLISSGDRSLDDARKDIEEWHQPEHFGWPEEKSWAETRVSKVESKDPPEVRARKALQKEGVNVIDEATAENLIRDAYDDERFDALS
jgi:hypothetical protein